MNLNTYVFFNGQCREAFEFYAKALGGKIVMMQTYAESPEAERVSKDWRGKIIHARLRLGDHVLMGSDAPPERFRSPQGFDLNVGVADPAEAERIFQALAAGGKVLMPIGETFWAVRFGALVDQFGIPWMVNCEKAA